MPYRRLASLKTAAAFRQYQHGLGLELPFEEELQRGESAALAQPRVLRNGFKIGNRFCTLPMEGWDGASDGTPTEYTTRRWQRFGASGAKLIWGGEAVAVSHESRANPRQLWLNEKNLAAFARLREALVYAHHDRFGKSDDLYVGLQLTHSGRFCKPNRNDRTEPRILYHHPILDRKFGIAASHPVLQEEEIARTIEDFVHAAQLAQAAGFAFVDLKHCHGYLGHEFLSAIARAGRYGGSFENRTRFLRETVAGIRSAAPALEIAVRVSACDFIPFRKGANGAGEPEPWPARDYAFAFGADRSGLQIDLTEPRAFLDLLVELGVQLVCISAGSPYYTPHLIRPAMFPPSDGYLPPEDPLVGVARHIAITAELKQQQPDLVFVGSGYSYLQEWLPHVAQAAVHKGFTDFVGLGRMALAYPDMPADVLAGKPLQRKRICRTFSDCTTAPRNGLRSGCYPLDEFYKSQPEAKRLARATLQPVIPEESF
jgi:2,4-dienoyl-CoA reductase-like NADH-dependent reductase (Old Yellow Enzyme family)